MGALSVKSSVYSININREGLWGKLIKEFLLKKY
jgi:hypothetical protein